MKRKFTEQFTWLAPDAAGHGTEKVIEAVHKRMGKIPLMVVPVKLVATVITLAGGGSAGKEGPCTPIAGALFGVEALVLGQLFYDVLFPSFVAGIIGFPVASLLGVNYPHMQPAVVPQVTA